MNYTICKYCDHFIEENIDYTPESGFCQYIHLDDGDIEYNHNATPDETLPSGDWGILRPDLFTLNIDNRVGPNSYHHRRPPRVCPFCSSRELSAMIQNL